MLIAAIVFGPFLMAFVSYGIGRRQENARDIFVILVTFLELCSPENISPMSGKV